ncbi:MAG: DNA helicase [Anaerocolumna sp.]
MIQEIKKIVENYLKNAKLCNILLGTVTEGGVQVSDKLTIPEELIVGNLKKEIATGDKVRLLRNYGGQLFYLLEVIK